MTIAGRGQAGAAWHLRAVRLPDGDRLEDWWIVDGCWETAPVPGAVDLPGGWFMPGGLVDAHTHLTIDLLNTGLAQGSAALIAANQQAHRQAGVLVVRDAGEVPGVALAAKPSCGPHVLSAGRMFAPPGRFHAHLHDGVSADELVAAALAEVEAGRSWIKIIADFPGADGNWGAPVTNYPGEVVRQLTEAVHAAGARVLAHTSGPFVAELVRVGVDSIEHGPAISPAVVREMAARGTAWTPTLATVAGVIDHLAGLPGPIGAYGQATLAQWRETLPLAVQLGVPVLAGTDEAGAGAIAQEVAQLRRFGLTAAEALASASTTARTYLGLAAMAAGGDADLAIFAADPRVDAAALACPTAVLFGGQRVR